MGLFTRREPPAPRAADDEDLDPQGMALELIDAFTERDEAGLAALTPEQRAEQVRVRHVLHGYVDAMWEDAKARGLDLATRPEWNAVAGIRDLTMDLWLRAETAQADDE